MKSDRQLIAECNELAKKFSTLLGYVPREGLRMYEESRNHRGRLYWSLAVLAYAELRNTDIEGIDYEDFESDDSQEEVKTKEKTDE